MVEVGENEINLNFGARRLPGISSLPERMIQFTLPAGRNINSMKNSGTMHTVYLSLGSNLGDRRGKLDKGLDLINSRVGNIIKKSGIYESGAWGFDSKNMFYNMCVEVKTFLSPAEVMQMLLDIEKQMGRIRSGEGYNDRVIDIDLLFYDDLILDTQDLVVPHPGITGRKFVLLPLAEIVPGYIHPRLLSSVADLEKACKDRNPVLPID